MWKIRANTYWHYPRPWRQILTHSQWWPFLTDFNILTSYRLNILSITLFPKGCDSFSYNHFKKNPVDTTICSGVAYDTRECIIIPSLLFCFAGSRSWLHRHTPHVTLGGLWKQQILKKIFNEKIWKWQQPQPQAEYLKYNLSFVRRDVEMGQKKIKKKNVHIFTYLYIYSIWK